MAISSTHAQKGWLSFDDEEGTWLFDMSFLLSDWTCIFGSGCKGVRDDDATEAQQGCCSYGAHFADKADRLATLKTIKRLTPEDWENHGIVEDPKKLVKKDSEGNWTTILHDDACVMLNSSNFHSGAGCSLHAAALRVGDRPMDWKPEVCWQLPLRLTFSTDENDHTTHTLRAWERRDWGEGGAEFHWWCTDAGQAQNAQRPTYRELADEITEMIGEARYSRLCGLIEEIPEQGSVSVTELGNTIKRRRDTK